MGVGVTSYIKHGTDVPLEYSPFSGLLYINRLQNSTFLYIYRLYSTGKLTSYTNLAPLSTLNINLLAASMI